MIFNLQSDAEGMHVTSNGIVTWTQPIGRGQPYKINLTLDSQAGESMISWNLTVIPTYSPIITRITNVGETNKRAIQGIVQFIDQKVLVIC